MTISSETRKAGPFTGNNVATVFAFTFKVFSAADLTVVRADLQGVETTLVLGTDYTASVNADQNTSPGGSITLAVPLAAGYALVITTSLTNLQPTDLTNNGGFYPQVITNALDRLTIMVQQLTERVSRTLRVSITTPAGVNPELPAPAADSLLGWSSGGNAIVNFPTTTALLGTVLAGSSGSSIVGFLQSGTGAVARTAQDKMRDVVSVFDFMTTAQIADVQAGTALVDVTAAVQAAINALKTMTHSDPLQTYTVGGGTVFFPRGTYLVTDTLLFPGSVILKGDAMLSSYIKFRPASAKTLFKGNTTKYSRGTSWDYVAFENLFIGGDLFTTQFADIAFDLSNVGTWNIRRCVVEQFTKGVYKTGAGYYHVIDHCYFYQNRTHIYDNGGTNPTTVVGGVIWNYGPTWPSDRKPDYLIYNAGKMSFHGTSIEPQTSANDATTFVCIYNDIRGTVSLNGCYSESQYPLVSHDCDNAYYSKSSLNLVYPYVFPLVRLRNFKSATVEVASFDYMANTPSFDLGMSPVNTKLFKNGSLNKGVYKWGLGAGTNYSTALDTAEKLFNKTGVLVTTFTDANASTRVICASQTIPATELAQYTGQTVYFATLVNYSANVTEERFQISQTGSSPLSYKYASRGRSYIDYGNGWRLYVVSLKVSGAYDVVCAVNANVLSGTTGTVKVAGFFAYLNGWEMFPYEPINSQHFDTAAPTTGTWVQGDIVMNSAPSAGGTPGWVCTTAGTPGTWKAMANLAA